MITQKEVNRMWDIVGNLVVNAATQVLIKKGQLLPKGGLVESIQYNVNERNEIEFLVNKYYQYYVDGRKPFSKKVPISALLKWIKRYRRKVGRGRDKRGKYITDLSYAFAIQTAIYKKGIKAKQDPIQQALDIANDAIEKAVYDDFTVILFADLDKFFGS